MALITPQISEISRAGGADAAYLLVQLLRGAHRVSRDEHPQVLPGQLATGLQLVQQLHSWQWWPVAQPGQTAGRSWNHKWLNWALTTS